MTPPAPLPRAALRRFLVAVGVCVALYSVVLFQLARLALKSELHSHIILIPVISAYLVWIRRQSIPRLDHRAGLAAGIFALLALLAALGYIFSIPWSGLDALSMGAVSFVCMMAAVVAWTLGRATLRQLIFPVAFLLFMVPLPTPAVDALETVLQYASAEAAALMYPLTGIPVLRDGLIFTLPNITLRVAQECSGIRSTIVLFITSFLAAHLFLRHRGYQAALVVATIVIGILRNGFRVVVISWLCVKISPDMIHSIIHRRGGPLFFALSLIPMAGVLYLLMKLEARKTKKERITTDGPSPIA